MSSSENSLLLVQLTTTSSRALGGRLRVNMFQVARFNFDDATGQDMPPAVVEGDKQIVEAASVHDSQSIHLQELHRLAMARKRQQIPAKTKARVQTSAGVPFDGVHETPLQERAKKRKGRENELLSNALVSPVLAQQGVQRLSRRQRRRLAQGQGVHSHSSLSAGGARAFEEDDTLFINDSKRVDGHQTHRGIERGYMASAPGSSAVSDAVTGTMLAVENPLIALDRDARDWGVDPTIVSALQAGGFSHFFPIQRRAIPLVLRGDSRVSGLHEDVCVSAPTGSGKTIVYAVATVQALIKRVIPRLRALVILPSRDLAIQVFDVFAKLCSSLPLRVAMAISSHRTSFVDEQPLVTTADILVCTPGRLMDHLRGTPGFTLEHLQMLIVDEADRLLAQSYQSWVSAVLERVRPAKTRGSFSCPSQVAVGALNEPVFSAAAYPAFSIEPSTFRGNLTHDAAQTSSLFAGRLRKLLFSATLTTDPQHIASLELVNPRFVSLGDSTPNYAAHILMHGTETRAGNTHGISNISAFSHPKNGPKRVKMFRTPDLLRENVILCAAPDKPWKLILLLRSLIAARGEESRTLVFTRSVSSAHRLCRLLQLFEICEDERVVFKKLAGTTGREPGRREMVGDGGIHDEARSLHGKFAQTKVSEYSSLVPPKQRANTLRRFSRRGLGADGKSSQVMVCSDAGSRGLDMEVVTSVVNYDAPTLAKAYVHRVGRTARAGRSGSCYTMLQPGQQGGFHALMKQIEHNQVLVHRVVGEEDRVCAVRDILPEALQRLKKVMELEEDEPAYRAQ